MPIFGQQFPAVRYISLLRREDAAAIRAAWLFPLIFHLNFNFRFPDNCYLYNMILITGATGLTGSHLALHLLQNNEDVRAICRNPNSIQKTKALFALYQQEHLFPKIEWLTADICDIPALELAFKDVTQVYHCAALISFDPNDEERLRKTNIEGTANIVNLCLEFSVDKLCHVSSIAALGDLKEHETTITEETEWNPEKPHTDYAISKFGAEMEIWRGQQEGLKAVIVNPGVILGPGFWHSGSGEIFTLIKKGLRFYTQGVTGFVHVQDVVQIMYNLMKSEYKGERFAVVSHALTFQTVLNAIADAMKVQHPTTYAQPWMTSLAWKFDWIMSKLLRQKRKISRDDARSLHTVSHYSNDKIRNAITFTFKEIEPSVEEIVRLQITFSI